MYKTLKIILFCCVFVSPGIFGQNYIKTSYSQYGIGDLINSGFAYNKALGGSSLALRPKNQTNYLNPASYTSQDTLSFLFHMGLTSRFLKAETTNSKDKSNNTNVEFLTFGFPITRWWKFSLGLVPFTRMQYYFREHPLSDLSEEIIVDYNGVGGYNEFYIGSAFEVTDYLSIGANIGYLFGELKKTHYVNFVDETVGALYISEKLSINDFYYRFGVQAYHTFNDRHRVVFGATFDPATNIKTKQNSLVKRNFPGNYAVLIDTINFVNDSVSQTKLPARIGIGISYCLNNALLTTLEYSTQDFSKSKIYGVDENLINYSSVRFGLEYQPVPITEHQKATFLKRLCYRTGAHYTNTYYKIADTPIKDYGISAGIGIPWRNTKKMINYTMLNISYEYGIRGTISRNLVKETYNNVTISLVLHDFWFFKPKYD